MPRRPADPKPSLLRIIGGDLRGRKLLYPGDPRTRPMKDRVREAVFNLLGPAVKGKHALDLFAGTGALALEALSRGASRATLLERHFPTARVIRDNLASVGLSERAEVVAADAFVWIRQLAKGRQQLPADTPWTVFCSPPYDFYLERQDEMLELIETLARLAPPESMLVVESDERFSAEKLPGEWDVRPYPPAVIAIRRL